MDVSFGLGRCRAGDAVVGVIDVRSDRPAAFDEEERTLVARVAERLAARLG